MEIGRTRTDVFRSQTRMDVEHSDKIYSPTKKRVLRYKEVLEPVEKN